MLQLRVFGTAPVVAELAPRIQGIPGSRHVIRTGGEPAVVTADLVSQANANARPLARYLVFMIAAGVIAAFGVIYSTSRL